MSIPKFEGIKYRLCDEWNGKIQIEDKPINYLEVGAFYGGNFLSVADSYAKHPWSKLYVVDPWTNYAEYDEYKDLDMETVFDAFTRNIEHIKDKVEICRGSSYEKLPEFQNNFFDIIYLDGNHDFIYVLADAILSFSKLKVGGYMIFDDYDLGWEGVLYGVTQFIEYHKSRIEILGMHKNQAFLKKVA
jgi:hypothetical protein